MSPLDHKGNLYTGTSRCHHHWNYPIEQSEPDDNAPCMFNCGMTWREFKLPAAADIRGLWKRDNPDWAKLYAQMDKR